MGGRSVRNNTVNPWLTPTAPQYGCTTVLETGDPVVGIGVLSGSNPYFQTAGANADGYWHPEAEASTGRAGSRRRPRRRPR